MRSYELVFIVHPDLDESAFKDVVDRVRGWIDDGEGKVEKVDLWGKRKLAYPIRNQLEGQYVLMHTQMAPSFCGQLERNIGLLEPVLRHLITQKDS